MGTAKPSHEPDLGNRARGQWGENLAARHYERLGCPVIDRNWRSPTGELDLIVLDGDVHVFCEVKTRASDLYGPPAAAVTVAKQRRIRQLGEGGKQVLGVEMKQILRPLQSDRSIKQSFGLL